MSNFANVQAFSNVLTTELNTVADGSAASAPSSAIDNSTNLYGLADFSQVLGSINPTVASARTEIHILRRLADGSTYEDRTASTLVGTIVVATGSSTKEGMLPQVPIPPGHFKVDWVNRAGVTSAGSGNTLAIRIYDAKGA